MYLMRAAISLTILLIVSLFSGSFAHAVVYGVKTCGSGSPACGAGSGSVTGGGSLPPSLLFSFNENGSGLTNLGWVQDANGADLDVDGLAFSGTTLFGFNLSKSTVQAGSNIQADTLASQLISISLLTAIATPIGTSLDDRDIRGATFDPFGNLWAIDANANQLLRLSPITGNVLNSVNLAQAVSTVVDIAFSKDGTAYLSDLDTIYTLNTTTGALAVVDTEAGQGYAGLAFSDNAAPSTAFAYEVNGTDDVFTTDVISTVTSALLSDIFSLANGQLFNAGRGDLAAHVTPIIPIPAALPLFSGGLAILVHFGRRRRRQG